ncbi:MAG: hypothetical protein Q7U53_08715 [Anaerolineaceae bacterium]|nr:hypothetical protein [Anaerolineaceae bacterium]
MPIERKNTLGDVVEGLEGAIQIAFQMIFWPLTLKSRNRWGATIEETEMVLPGDNLIPNPKVGYTHAISIQCPKIQVWPWVAQLGQGRGGFYSYQALENIAGCQIYNTEEILPEYQELTSLSGIALHPKMPAVPLHSYQVNDYLLLHADSLTGQTTNQKSVDTDFIKVSWLFHMREIAPSITRLISRWRSDFPNTFAAKMGYGAPITGSMAHVMDVKMLKGIKKRAERV